MPIKKKNEIRLEELTESLNKLNNELRKEKDEHRLAEELILKEKAFIETVIISLPGIFYLFDSSGRFLKWNNNFEKVTGYTAEEIEKMHPLSLFDDDKDIVARKIQEVFTAGYSEVEAVLVAKNKERHPFYFNGMAITIDNTPCLIGSGLDITEHKRAQQEKESLEAQLQQAQKMEAVGLLAGGVAHDFNNVLTAIIGYSHILKEKLKNDEALRSYAEKIISVSDRAANIVRRLLAFSRKQIISPHPVDLNDVVRDIDKMLQNLIGEDIGFRTVIHEQALTVMADRRQMDQALINLITNARDAMPDGGVLSLETGSSRLDEDTANMHLFNKPGQYGFISVSDTGTGMNAETKDKIFEPFFTTKKTGKGTGLGLSMVYGIIKQHDGNINVYSEPGKGSNFKIYLPLIKSSGENQDVFPSGKVPVS